MPRAFLAFLLSALLLTPMLKADSFSLSHAPVQNDPSLTHRPTAKQWPHINIKEARRLLGRDGVVFLDGRSAYEWKVAHLPGALSVPAADFYNSFPTIKNRLIRAKVVVVYCHGFSCGIADYVCQMLAAQGLRNMCVFSGGYPQWKQFGYRLVGEDVPKREEHALSGTH